MHQIGLIEKQINESQKTPHLASGVTNRRTPRRHNPLQAGLMLLLMKVGEELNKNLAEVIKFLTRRRSFVSQATPLASSERLTQQRYKSSTLILMCSAVGRLHRVNPLYTQRWSLTGYEGFKDGSSLLLLCRSSSGSQPRRCRR